MTEPAVIFGLGAAKSGTTWLYRYLARHPGVGMPAIKELHWFDTCETGQWDRQIARMQAERARRTGRLPTGDAALDRRLTQEIAGYDAWIKVLETRGDEAAYLAFLRAGAPAKTTGEITPAYAALSEDSLARMARIAPVVRFIYLMRDPLDRLWSNVRMVAARDPGDFAANAAFRLNRVLAGGDRTTQARSDYAATLARLARAVDPAQLFTGFSEALFAGDLTRDLCGFLGIAARAAAPAAPVLPTRDLEMTAEQRARALEWLAPQYAAVAARCGPLPRRWQDNMEAFA